MLAAEFSRVGTSKHGVAVAGAWKPAEMMIRYTHGETARRGPWPGTSRTRMSAQSILPD